MHAGACTMPDMDRPPRIPVQARLPHELVDQLRNEAQTRGISQTRLIEQALVAYLGR